MRRFLTLLVFLPVLLQAQSDSISLAKYCPTRESQDGGICFAYAPAYTALSIMYNVAENKTDESAPGFNTFSFGFVASMVKKNKPFYNRAPFGCGTGGTLDLALGILLNNGTVPFAMFSEECACKRTGKFIAAAKQYKIKDTANIGTPGMDAAKHIGQIKTALKNKQPVMTAIVQEDFFGESRGTAIINFPADYKTTGEAANHVLCIVGYNDAVNGGSFLVKNNYSAWGKNGFAYVKYADMIKLIRWSYTMAI